MSITDNEKYISKMAKEIKVPSQLLYHYFNKLGMRTTSIPGEIGSYVNWDEFKEKFIKKYDTGPTHKDTILKWCKENLAKK